MKINKPNEVKKKVHNLSSTDLNFQKINNIMNKRLVGRLDYLTAYFYFSQYNIKKDKNEKNLKKFFKSKIFQKVPFILEEESKINNKKKEKQNKQLNIIINIKNDKINFKKNKFTSPFILYSKKNHFLRNMISFSQHFHSNEKKAEDIKERYPQLKSSFSLNLDSFHNFQENKNFLTPRISRINSGISTKDKKIFSANKKLNRNYKSLNDIDFHSFSMIKSKDKRIKSSKTILSLKNNNKKTNEIIQPKKRLKIKKKNHQERNSDEMHKEGKSYKNKSNNINNMNNAKKKLFNLIKVQRPNHYYNNLRLIKLSKLSKKNFYQNFDQ